MLWVSIRMIIWLGNIQVAGSHQITKMFCCTILSHFQIHTRFSYNTQTVRQNVLQFDKAYFHYRTSSSVRY